MPRCIWRAPLAIHPGDLTARKLLASLKLQTGAVEEAVQMLGAGRSPMRPTASTRTSSWPRPTTV